MKVKVVSENKYATVIAEQNIPADEIVLKIEGIIKSLPNKYTIQVGTNKHIESCSSDHADIRSTWRFINHSCKPNCSVDISGMNVIALRNIQTGEEITFDYNTTESEIVAPFLCNCGSQNCIGEIKGFNYLKKKQYL
jgi:hypothetical protein